MISKISLEAWSNLLLKAAKKHAKLSFWYLEVPQLVCNRIRIFRHAGTHRNSRDITKSSSEIRLTKVAGSWRLMTRNHGILHTFERQRMYSLSVDGKTPSSVEGFLTYFEEQSF